MKVQPTDSILKTIRQMLGPDVAYDAYDTDLLIHINSSLMVLMQLGIGPEHGFVVHGDSETWADFIGVFKDLESVKTYIYLKVKILFDPPGNSFVLDAYKKQADELEWRLNVQVEGSEHNAQQ